MKKLMLSVFALAAVVFSANAQVNTDAAEGTGKVILTTPIALEPGTNGGILDFGTLIINAEAAKVTMSFVDFEEYVSGTGTITTPGSAADYKVTGQINSYFGVTFSDCTLNGLLHPEAALTVTDFLASAPITIGETGVENFKVVGALNIPANAVVDSYSGKFTVTVTYN